MIRLAKQMQTFEYDPLRSFKRAGSCARRVIEQGSIQERHPERQVFGSKSGDTSRTADYRTDTDPAGSVLDVCVGEGMQTIS